MPLILDALYLALGLIASPWLLWRRLRGGRSLALKGRFGGGPIRARSSVPTVLLHAVSVGEVEALETLVDAMERDGRSRPVVSATTDTGIAAADRLFGGRCDVVRFPLDLSWSVRRFLRRIDPAAVVLIELEVWPNFIRACRAKGVRVVVASGRISDANLRASSRLSWVLGPAFRALDLVVAQSDRYAERFRALGTPPDRVLVDASLKWDTAHAPGLRGRDAILADALGLDPERAVVLAISTGPGEEDMLVATQPDGVQLVLAPRRPERFDEVAARHPGIIRRSEHPDGSGGGTGGGDLVLLDTIGEIDRALSLADVAILGRSFLAGGGSNPMQPAAAGVPTIIGPRHEHFEDVVEALLAGDGIVVSSKPMEEVAAILRDPQRARSLSEGGRAVVASQTGAGERTVRRVLDLLAADGSIPPHTP